MLISLLANENGGTYFRLDRRLGSVDFVNNGFSVAGYFFRSTTHFPSCLLFVD